jgi:tetratricopeptide (TPR) repeat protein
MELTKSRQFDNNHRSARWVGIILFLTIFAGLCISTAAYAQEGAADHWIKEGYKLKWKGSFDEANKSFEKALEIYNEGMIANPKDINITNKKSLVLVSLGRMDEAVLTLDKAIEKDPDNPLAWCNKGFTLITIAASNPGDKANMYNASLRALDKALDLDPNNAEAWRGKGLAYSNLENQSEALKALDRAIEINPKYGQAWLDKGVLLLGTGRAEEALPALDMALAVEPDNIDALSTKAEALSALGRYDESTAVFDRAMQMNSGDIETVQSNGDWL